MNTSLTLSALPLCPLFLFVLTPPFPLSTQPHLPAKALLNPLPRYLPLFFPLTLPTCSGFPFYSVHNAITTRCFALETINFSHQTPHLNVNA